MSIKQNAYSDGLPDFRNLGVTARILVAVNLAALVAACYAENSWVKGIGRFSQDAAFIEPALLASIVTLYILSPALAAMRYPIACVVVLAAVLCIAGGLGYLLQPVSASLGLDKGLSRVLAFSALAVVVLLAYLRLRAKAYSPALT